MKSIRLTRLSQEQLATLRPDHPAASGIKAIDKTSVHRICSGQVVLTLAVAVKELVENSIDAGATNIDIRLKEYGSELIEVSDNGKGVEEKDFEGLTLKHHTSKLQEFSDLANVETFGFRGEALSSLCALSEMCIITHHEKASVGTKLEFDQNGKIKSRTPCPRQKGTTVSIQNLFSTLPVRHKEFRRNIKKEFVKMVQVLNAYCIISLGVRITCSNQIGKGNRQCVVSTKGNSSLRENISNIFGPKQFQSLLEFKQLDPSEDICSDYGIKCLKNTAEMFRLEGFVSKCDHGLGRSSTDRQFLFMNERPFDSSKITKVANEVYHSYNRHQYPFLAIHIRRDRETVDVNVTPDKRQIFIQDVKILLASLKYSLIRMYEPTTSILQVQTTLGGLTRSLSQGKSDSESGEFSSPTLNNYDADITPGSKLEKGNLSNSLSKLKRSFASAFAKEDDKSTIEKSPKQLPAKQRRLDAFVQRNDSVSSETVVEESTPNKTRTDNMNDDSGLCDSELSSSQETVIFITPSSQNDFHIQSSDSQELSISSSVEQKFLSNENLESSQSMFRNVTEEKNLNKSSFNDTVIHHHSPSQNSSLVSNNNDSPVIPNDNSESHSDIIGNVFTKDIRNDGELQQDNHVTLLEYDEKSQSRKKESQVKFSLTKLKEKREQKKIKDQSNQSEFCRKFRATINPSENVSAEEELQREIRQDMFQEMEILGQFNLGFIIAKLNEDLFIIDQHATDEKYNFETLQKTTVIQSQKMICPQSLELTASNEIILMDNLDIFKKNGFDFVIDEEANPTQRVKLISTPVSKNWNFGKEDIEELIFMLTDSPGVTCRPSRIRQMFASRACRKSIMIGTALNKQEMRKLVCHMGEIEQPWNCPHGRPTMRHLINLKMIQR